MLSLILALALHHPIAFAKTAEKPPTRIRVYVGPRNFDEAFEPFTKPPVKCVPHPPKPMTEHQQWLMEATEQKPAHEVEKYLRCYAPKNFNDYETKYRNMIDTAAAKFQVDASLMKCLLMRESQWDSSMVSCTCAMGLGQQTSENMLSMKGTVAATLSGPAWTSYMSEMRAQDPNFDKTCSGEFKRSNEETDTNSAFYKSVMAGRERGCGKQAINCRVFRQDDRRCPAASIAGTAAYLKYIDSIVRKSVNCGQIEPWQIPDSRLAIALAYNAGEGTFIKAIKKANDANTTISINFLDGAEVSPAKMKEMRGHYRALRFCLHKGEIEPMAPGDRRKPECFAPAQQQMVNGGAISR